MRTLVAQIFVVSFGLGLAFSASTRAQGIPTDRDETYVLKRISDMKSADLKSINEFFEHLPPANDSTVREAEQGLHTFFNDLAKKESGNLILFPCYGYYPMWIKMGEGKTKWEKLRTGLARWRKDLSEGKRVKLPDFLDECSELGPLQLDLQTGELTKAH